MSGIEQDWQAALAHWLAPFLDHLGHKARRRMCPIYVAGLIGPGERKSIEPIATRLAPADYDQLHHFVCEGIWDPAPLEAELRAKADGLVGGPEAVLVIDDTALVNRAGFSGGHLFGSRRHGWLFQRGIVACLGFGRRHVANGLE